MLLRILILACSFMWALNVNAANPIKIHDLKGLALVKISSKRVQMELEQAIQIKGSEMLIVGLDDFGGEVYKFYFTPAGLSVVAQGQLMATGRNKLKKIISLPLKQQEFLNVLRYHLTDSFVARTEGQTVVWQHKKKPKIWVVFDQFKKIEKGSEFPGHVSIKYKKHYLDLSWISYTVAND